MTQLLTSEYNKKLYIHLKRRLTINVIFISIFIILFFVIGEYNDLQYEHKLLVNLNLSLIFIGFVYDVIITIKRTNMNKHLIDSRLLWLKTLATFEERINKPAQLKLFRQRLIEQCDGKDNLLEVKIYLESLIKNKSRFNLSSVITFCVTLISSIGLLREISVSTINTGFFDYYFPIFFFLLYAGASYFLIRYENRRDDILMEYTIKILEELLIK